MHSNLIIANGEVNWIILGLKQMFIELEYQDVSEYADK